MWTYAGYIEHSDKREALKLANDSERNLIEHRFILAISVRSSLKSLRSDVYYSTV